MPPLTLRRGGHRTICRLFFCFCYSFSFLIEGDDFEGGLNPDPVPATQGMIRAVNDPEQFAAVFIAGDGLVAIAVGPPPLDCDNRIPRSIFTIAANAVLIDMNNGFRHFL